MLYGSSCFAVSDYTKNLVLERVNVVNFRKTTPQNGELSKDYMEAVASQSVSTELNSVRVNVVNFIKLHHRMVSFSKKWSWIWRLNIRRWYITSVHDSLHVEMSYTYIWIKSRISYLSITRKLCRLQILCRARFYAVTCVFVDIFDKLNDWSLSLQNNIMDILIAV